MQLIVIEVCTLLVFGYHSLYVLILSLTLCVQGGANLSLRERYHTKARQMRIQLLKKTEEDRISDIGDIAIDSTETAVDRYFSDLQEQENEQEDANDEDDNSWLHNQKAQDFHAELLDLVSQDKISQEMYNEIVQAVAVAATPTSSFAEMSPEIVVGVAADKKTHIMQRSETDEEVDFDAAAKSEVERRIQALYAEQVISQQFYDRVMVVLERKSATNTYPAKVERKTGSKKRTIVGTNILETI